MTNAKVQRKDVYSPEELVSMNKNLELFSIGYFRLRSGAIHSISYKTGKRRCEVARLLIEDLSLNDAGDLNIRFTVAKKRKKEESLILTQRTKTIPNGDSYGEMVKQYFDFMKKNHPNCKYLFPSGKAIFSNYIFDYSKPISGRQLLRIIKTLNVRGWQHLYRETVGAKIIDKNPTLDGVFAVSNRLDIEFNTAVHYFQRHVKQRLEKEEIEKE
jgi:integrase